MQQGQYGGFRHGGRPRRSTGRRVANGMGVFAILAGAVLVATPPAGAVGTRTGSHGTAAPGPGATRTTVVTPTTTVTTTTRPGSSTTSTTTVTTSSTDVTSTTVTTVVATTTTRPVAPGQSPPGGTRSVTTTTTVPTATVPTTSTTSPPTTSTRSTTAPPAVPGPATFDSTCSQPATPGLQTYLASLPAGSVFRSSSTACYEVPSGIVLRNPITIVGGTFYDPSTVKPTGPGYDSMKPIILVRDTSHVTISGVSVLGANTVGGFHAALVGEAGVKIESSLDVTLDDDSSLNTWGDGLELVADLSSHIGTPVTGLTVEGFTSDNAGRQGVTLAEVSDSSLDNVHVISPADAGFDFESDIPGAGSDNVSISNCTDDAGFNIAEFLAGPITVTNCSGFHHVTLRSPTSNVPVTFVGGTLTCKRINPQPCIHQFGGSLIFLRVAINRESGSDAIRDPVWSVDDGGSLDFVHSPIQDPFGTTTQAASVRIVK